MPNLLNDTYRCQIAHPKIEYSRAMILTDTEVAVFTRFSRSVRNWLGIIFSHLQVSPASGKHEGDLGCLHLRELHL